MTLRKKNFVLPITTTSDKEGWLKKGKHIHKQQKRYFVLKDTSLAWFANANVNDHKLKLFKRKKGKIKGSIDVRNFHIVPIGNDSDEEYAFQVIPLEEGTSIAF